MSGRIHGLTVAMSLGGRQVARVAALAAAWVTIGVHIDLANDHLVEKTYIGVLFLVGAAMLVPTVHGLAPGLSVRAVVWGALVNVGMIAAFVASRTTGLPGGFHEPWTSDYGLGLVALGAETSFLVATVVMLWPSYATWRGRARPVGGLGQENAAVPERVGLTM